jgi:hypothetical protein
MHNADNTAFPMDFIPNEQFKVIRGLTKREYFAAHAPDVPADFLPGHPALERVLDWRWTYADAMLSEQGETA